MRMHVFAGLADCVQRLCHEVEVSETVLDLKAKIREKLKVGSLHSWAGDSRFVFLELWGPAGSPRPPDLCWGLSPHPSQLGGAKAPLHN